MFFLVCSHVAPLGLLIGKALVLYRHIAPLGLRNLLNLTPMGSFPLLSNTTMRLGLKSRCNANHTF